MGEQVRVSQRLSIVHKWDSNNMAQVVESEDKYNRADGTKIKGDRDGTWHSKGTT